MWLLFGFFDTIIKAFQYGYVILVPMILIIIFYSNKKSKIKNISNHDTSELMRLSNIVNDLIIIVVLLVFTSRIWGPPLYKHIIAFSIANQESEIEEKLEKKYNRNFTFVSKDDIIMEPDSGNGFGQDINNDYSIIYRFADDDGVIAIIEYKKNSSFDHYVSKRSKYEIEKSIYDYALQTGFNNEFYVFLTSPYESITYSRLDGEKSDNFILSFISEERNLDCIEFILTNQSEENKTFIKSALKSIHMHFDVYEYIVTEKEYKRAINFYESSEVKNGIERKDYNTFDFNEDEKIYSTNY